VPNRAVVLKNIAAMHDFPTPIGKVTFDAAGDMTTPTLTLMRLAAGGKVQTVTVLTLK
jgi:ABC-type branched-subunit amino acid transport system substrate-binding protein